MFFLISLAISLLLAIPTYGLSLVVFFLAKNWLDNKALNALLGAAVIAMREGVSEERYHINRSAIRKIFARYAVRPLQVLALGDGGASLYWGVIRHPLINDGQIFSVRFGYIPRQGSSNVVFVKAAPGVDDEVLSADDLMSLAPLAGSRPMHAAKIDNTKPRDDSDIKNLIVRAAGLKDTELACPKLNYGVLGDFLSRNELSTEYFPNYSGARFWIDIGEFSYAVCASTLKPGAKDASGISLSATIDGYASAATQSA